jgi:hypothetical protein
MHFGGLTLQEASAKFDEAPEVYHEDFMFMGGRAFAYYFPVLDQFLRKTIDLPSEKRGDRQSWVIPQCIHSHFFSVDLPFVSHLKTSIIDLCDFMLDNIDHFKDDWDDVAEIRHQWQRLKTDIEAKFVG